MRKTFTPTYDSDYIPKWYFDQEVSHNIIGEVRAFAGTKVPDGWLLCNGDNISRTTYKQLFDVIGTGYGAGDGATTFTLPTYADSVNILGYKIIKY